MGKGIILGLGILLVLTLLNVFAGGGFIGNSTTMTADYTVLINGTGQTVNYEDQTIALGLGELEGAIAWFLIIAVVVALLCFQIIGTGVGEIGQRTIRTTIIYTGLWSVLSVTSWALIMSIASFGWLIWLTLTIIYAIGVFQKMGDQG